LEIHPPQLTALVSRVISAKDPGQARHRAHNLKQLGVAGFELSAFGDPPHIGDALFFGFKNDLSHHLLGLKMECVTATGMGIDTRNPPWQWECWAGDENGDWAPVVVERDETGGLNQSGLILLRLPPMARRDFRQQRAYWLRCRVVDSPEGRNYDRSPHITNVEAQSWGGTVWSTHATTVNKEPLGRSDGSPGQVFQLEHTPVLPRREGETVQVWNADSGSWEAWQEVEDFSTSSGQDRHFTLNPISGEVRFGPAIRQPDGTVRSYGAIPPRGAEMRFSAYRYGGGVEGNLQAHTLTVIKSGIPYLDRVDNPQEARGGLDAESIEAAQMRAPRLLRTRGRAVTPEDYETLALEADPRVARARCIQPPAAGAEKGPLAAHIYLLLVPRVHQARGPLAPEQLEVDKDLQAAVGRYLERYRLLTVRVDIRPPAYMWVAAHVALAAQPEADPQRVETQALERLYAFLNPLAGGPSGRGWPFGRDLYPSDIYRCLQGLPGLDYIESVTLTLLGGDGQAKPIEGRLPIPAHGLVASAEHAVRVSQAR
jgi:predicted phage baseplate assembly protein